MALNCNKESNQYLRMLMQLLPPGYAWQWSPSSVGRHLLAAWSDELARVHNDFCQIGKEGVQRFAGEISGWSASDYEALLLNSFDITATVTPYTLADDQHLSISSDKKRFWFVIEPATDEDLDRLDQVVRDYLSEYKQSHTQYWIKAQKTFDLPAAPAAGIMAIKFDKWDGLHIGANTATSADMGLLLFASQPKATTLSADADSVAPVATGLFIFAQQQHSPININTDSKTASGMHVFTHATG